MLGEDDGVAVGLDTGQEQEALSRPALVQSHVGPQLVLPSTTAAAGVQSQVASGERDLATVEMVDQVGVPEQSYNSELHLGPQYFSDNFHYKFKLCYDFANNAPAQYLT